MNIGVSELLVLAFLCVLLVLVMAVGIATGILISKYKKKT